MAALVFILIFSALTGYSSGSYCLCKDGMGDQALQKTLDYACGAGADCTAILQNGACFQPNTLKDHCSYAANSYYQKKLSSQATCDFSGSATLSANPPSGLLSTCVYPSSTSSTTTTPTTGTPTTTPPSTTTTGGTTTTTPSTTTTGGGTAVNNPFGLGPTGSSFDNGATAAGASLLLFLISSALTLLMASS